MKKVLILAMAAMLMAVFISGCNPEYDNRYERIETEYFKVQMHVADEKKGENYESFAVIYDLTPLGKQQEILVFPDYVNGLPVKTIGAGSRRIKSDVVKKVYLPRTLQNIEGGGLEFIEIVCLSAVGFSYTIIRAQKVIMTIELYERDFVEHIAVMKNLAYYYNYENSPNRGYYWIDYITGENLYFPPPSSIREGYTFTGWYLEPECETEWNGILPASEDEKLELYAGWNEN